MKSKCLQSIVTKICFTSLVKEFTERNPLDSGTVLPSKLRLLHHIHYGMFDENQMFKQKKPSTPGCISQPVTTLSLRHLQKHPGVERLSTPGCVKKTLIEKKNAQTMASSSKKSTETTVIHI